MSTQLFKHRHLERRKFLFSVHVTKIIHVIENRMNHIYWSHYFFNQTFSGFFFNLVILKLINNQTWSTCDQTELMRRRDLNDSALKHFTLYAGIFNSILPRIGIICIYCLISASFLFIQYSKYSIYLKTFGSDQRASSAIVEVYDVHVLLAYIVPVCILNCCWPTQRTTELMAIRNGLS